MTSNVNVAAQASLREESGLTQFAFSRLLEWLDDGTDSCGRTYIEMRQRLVTYFDRRNRPFADDLADETLTRVGKTLERTGRISVTPPARYCYVVARFVLLEDIRRERRLTPLDETSRRLRVLPATSSVAAAEDAALQEGRFACLERCLERLTTEQRTLAVDYYGGSGGEKIARRRGLAQRLGISMNALAIRICRIRAALQECVDDCCRQPRHSR